MIKTINQYITLKKNKDYYPKFMKITIALYKFKNKYQFKILGFQLMHADLPQRVCLKCPASFLSLEELEAHQQKHNRIQNRPYVCPICEKK